MEFRLKDFSAKPEARNFSGDLYIKNFESPEIDLSLDSDFDLAFLTQFINATSFSNLKGKIEIHMKFHDIIDLTRPERSIERLNETYYTELEVTDLGFSSPAFHLPLSSLNTWVIVEGHEEISALKLHGELVLDYEDSLKSIDLDITELGGKMKVHPLKLEKFNGNVHYEDDRLLVQDFSGNLGSSEFTVNLDYYLREGERASGQNYFGLAAKRLNFDELLEFNEIPVDAENSAEEHAAAFNIYELPFSDMQFEFDIDHLNYHRNILYNFKAELRTTPEHYLYIATLNMNVAGGQMALGGYFNGSNPDEIYLNPIMHLEGVDLDKLLYKFENFGQNEIVSDNLKGRLTADITGKVRMYPDLVPIIDQSEIHMDVTVLDGRLIEYEMLSAFEEYFVDKNLEDVRFDTLQNHIDLVDGTLVIPNMTINSTLGFLQISGTQDADFNMEYYIRVPLKMVAGTGWSKLFGRKKEEVDPNQVDEIVYVDPEKKVAFINIKMIGNSEDYEVSLGRDKGSKKKNKNKD